MNPLINNQPQQTQKMPDIGQLYQNFIRNPVDFMIKSKFNIPQNVGNNPQNIIQHLLNSGQISQQQLNQAQSMMPQFRQMFGR